MAEIARRRAAHFARFEAASDGEHDDADDIHIGGDQVPTEGVRKGLVSMTVDLLTLSTPLDEVGSPTWDVVQRSRARGKEGGRSRGSQAEDHEGVKGSKGRR